MELIKNICFTWIGVVIGIAIKTEIMPLTTEFTPLEFFALIVIFLLLIMVIRMIEELSEF